MGRFVSAVERYAGQNGKFFHKSVQQFPFVGDVLAECGVACGTGGGEGENCGGGLGAASQVAFLTAAEEQGRERLQPGGDIQCAGTLGAVNLVCGDRDQIGAQCLGQEGNLQKTLDRIGVKHSVGAELVS